MAASGTTTPSIAPNAESTENPKVDWFLPQPPALSRAFFVFSAILSISSPVLARIAWGAWSTPLWVDRT